MEKIPNQEYLILLLAEYKQECKIICNLETKINSLKNINEEMKKCLMEYYQDLDLIIKNFKGHDFKQMAKVNELIENTHRSPTSNSDNNSEFTIISNAVSPVVSRKSESFSETTIENYYEDSPNNSSRKSYKIQKIALNTINNSALAICDDKKWRLFKRDEVKCVCEIEENLYGPCVSAAFWTLPKSVAGENKCGFVILTDNRLLFLHQTKLRELSTKEENSILNPIRKRSIKEGEYRGNFLLQEKFRSPDDNSSPHAITYLIYFNGYFVLYRPSYGSANRLLVIKPNKTVNEILKEEVVKSGFIHNLDKLGLWTLKNNEQKLTLLQVHQIDNKFVFVPFKSKDGEVISVNQKKCEVISFFSKTESQNLFVSIENGNLDVSAPSYFQRTSSFVIQKWFQEACRNLEKNIIFIAQHEKYIVAMARGREMDGLGFTKIFVISMKQIINQQYDWYTKGIREVAQFGEHLPLSMDVRKMMFVFPNNEGQLIWTEIQGI